DVDEVATLASVVNNSTVGASKLLHFASPTRYAIWDSRVARYLCANRESGRRAAQQYIAYNDCCRYMSDSTEANALTSDVSRVVGYHIHPMRALEVVMFHAGLAGRSYC